MGVRDRGEGVLDMSQSTQPPAVADSLTSVPPPAPIQVGDNGSPGGYHFEPDQVQSVINKWQKLLSDLLLDRNNAVMIATVQPPASDVASSRFVSNGANPSGQTLLQQHDRMVQYVENYIEALRKAGGQIQQAEDDAQQTVNQSAQGVM